MNKSSTHESVSDIRKLPLEERKALAERYSKETKGLFPFVVVKDPKSSLKSYETPKV